MDDSYLYFIASASDDSLPESPTDCLVQAVCRTKSRMYAVRLMRQSGLHSVSSKRLEKMRSVVDITDLGIPAIGQGEVWARRVFDDTEWSRRST